MTVGQALQFAKQQYLESAAFGVYDHKALQEATTTACRSGAWAPTVRSPRPCCRPPLAAAEPARHDLRTAEVRAGHPAGSAAPRGDYFVTKDETGTPEHPQVTAYRPIQPQRRRPWPPRPDGLVAHGATLESLTTTRWASTRSSPCPIVDDSDLQPEPPVGPGVLPVHPAADRHADDARQGSAEDVLGARAGPVPGHAARQRGPRHPAPGDRDRRPGPLVRLGATSTLRGVVEVHGGVDPASACCAISVDGCPGRATPTGCSRCTSPTRRRPGRHRPHLEQARAGQGRGGDLDGPALVPAGTTDVDQFYVQAVDTAGNVTVDNNKGRELHAPSPTVLVGAARRPDAHASPTPLHAASSPARAPPRAPPAAPRPARRPRRPRPAVVTAGSCPSRRRARAAAPARCPRPPRPRARPRRPAPARPRRRARPSGPRAHVPRSGSAPARSSPGSRCCSAARHRRAAAWWSGPTAGRTRPTTPCGS